MPADAEQYRYHSRWREVRDEAKYSKMLVFGRVLPRIRQRVEEDLARRGLCREKVLASVVRLLEITLMRVGNEEYAKANRSFGLTTLRNRHVKVEGGRLHFDFRGKHGLEHHIDLKDRRLAGIVKRLQDLPGQDLFHFLDEDGNPHPIGSDDVNEYLREITGEDITAKDFVPGLPRTWQRSRCVNLNHTTARRRQKRTWSRRWKQSPRCWAIHQLSAASATSIRRFSMAIWTDHCCRPCNGAPNKGWPNTAMD